MGGVIIFITITAIVIGGDIANTVYIKKHGDDVTYFWEWGEIKSQREQKHKK